MLKMSTCSLPRVPIVCSDSQSIMYSDPGAQLLSASPATSTQTSTSSPPTAHLPTSTQSGPSLEVDSNGTSLHSTAAVPFVLQNTSSDWPGAGTRLVFSKGKIYKLCANKQGVDQSENKLGVSSVLPASEESCSSRGQCGTPFRLILPEAAAVGQKNISITVPTTHMKVHCSQHTDISQEQLVQDDEQSDCQTTDLRFADTNSAEHVVNKAVQHNALGDACTNTEHLVGDMVEKCDVDPTVTGSRYYLEHSSDPANTEMMSKSLPEQEVLKHESTTLLHDCPAISVNDISLIQTTSETTEEEFNQKANVKVEVIENHYPGMSDTFEGGDCFTICPSNQVLIDHILEGYGPHFIAEEVIAADPTVAEQPENLSAVTTDSLCADAGRRKGSFRIHRLQMTEKDSVQNSTSVDATDGLFQGKESQISTDDVIHVISPSQNENMESLPLSVCPDDAPDLAMISVDSPTLQLTGEPSSIITVTISDTHHLTDQILADAVRHEMKSVKRARDRALKKSKRQNPTYREKETEKCQIRMKNLRKDPEYREQERQRDCLRRRMARQQNKQQRELERQRDRISKQLKRVEVLSNMDRPDHHGNLGEDSSDLGNILHLGGEVEVLKTNGMDFSVGSSVAMEVYNEMEIKDAECSEDFE